MADIKVLIGLAFAACIGLTLLVLGCALPMFQVWWPLFVVVFYLLSPVPLLMARRMSDDMSSSSACVELAIFATTGIVVSAFGLPVVLAHSGSIHWVAALCTLAGNVVTFATICGYFYIDARDDDDFGNRLF